MSSDLLYCITGRTSLTLRGLSPKDAEHAVITNVSQAPAVFVCDDGSLLEIPPSGIVTVPTRPDRIYRLSCNGCGRSNGTHAPDCPR